MSHGRIGVHVSFEGKSLTTEWPNGFLRIADDFRYLYFTNESTEERKNYRINRFLPEKLQERCENAPFCLEMLADPNYPGTQDLQSIKLNFGASKPKYQKVIAQFNEAIERHQDIFPKPLDPNKKPKLRPVQQKMAEHGEDIKEFIHWNQKHPDNTEKRRQIPERMFRQLIDGCPPGFICKPWFLRRSNYYAYSEDYFNDRFEMNQKLGKNSYSRAESSREAPRRPSKAAGRAKTPPPPPLQKKKKTDPSSKETSESIESSKTPPKAPDSSKMAFRTKPPKKAPKLLKIESDPPKSGKRSRKSSTASQATSEAISEAPRQSSSAKPPKRSFSVKPAPKERIMEEEGPGAPKRSKTTSESSPIFFESSRIQEPLQNEPETSSMDCFPTFSPPMTPNRPPSPILENTFPSSPAHFTLSPSDPVDEINQTENNQNTTMDEMMGEPKFQDIQPVQVEQNNNVPPIRRIVNTHISNSRISNASLWNCIVENSRLVGCTITSGPRMNQ